MTYRSEEAAVRNALVKCGEVRSKLRETLNILASWSDMNQFPCPDEAALRERMDQLHQLAKDAKDYDVD